jgi:hypothetical protein
LAVSTWRVPVRRRIGSLALAVTAEAIAITVVATGPRESVAFDLRLPLLVGLVAGLICAAQWRRRTVVIPPDPGPEPRPEPVPMATPWLVLNSSAGVAVLAAKGYENHPALIEGMLVAAGVICLFTIGLCLSQWLRPEPAYEPQ